MSISPEKRDKRLANYWVDCVVWNNYAIGLYRAIDESQKNCLCSLKKMLWWIIRYDEAYIALICARKELNIMNENE